MLVIISPYQIWRRLLEFLAPSKKGSRDRSIEQEHPLKLRWRSLIRYSPTGCGGYYLGCNPGSILRTRRSRNSRATKVGKYRIFAENGLLIKRLLDQALRDQRPDLRNDESLFVYSSYSSTLVSLSRRKVFAYFVAQVTLIFGTKCGPGSLVCRPYKAIKRRLKVVESLMVFR